MMRHVDLSDALIIVGLAMLAGGLAGYDWRLALIACGLVLLVFGVAAVLRTGQ